MVDVPPCYPGIGNGIATATGHQVVHQDWPVPWCPDTISFVDSGKIATFVVLRYATNLWKPVPGREIWGGFSIKNGINREKVVNFRTRKTPTYWKSTCWGSSFVRGMRVEHLKTGGSTSTPKIPEKRPCAIFGWGLARLHEIATICKIFPLSREKVVNFSYICPTKDSKLWQQRNSGYLQRPTKPPDNMRY